MVVAVEQSGMLIALYSVGFVMQIGGIVLLVLGIAGDIRAARALRGYADVPGPSATEIRMERPGLRATIGGLTMQPLAQGIQRSDSFRVFIADRLSHRLWLRILGVVLVLVGTTADFVANLVSSL